MAATYASVGDYTKRTPGPALTDAKRDQVAAMLVDASAIIRNAIPPGIDADPDVARALCVTIARRAITNPGGHRSRTIGGYAETLTDAGGLFITDDEIELLVGELQADAAYTVPIRDQGYPRRRYGCDPYEPYDPYDERFW